MEKILCCVRIKPEESSSPKDNILKKYAENSIINLKTGDVFQFDNVFDQQIVTHDIFTILIAPLINDVLSGINISVFAYGQTSSGKTFTMKGNEKCPGIIPLALKSIFQAIVQKTDYSFELKISYFEIYKENINDLLTPEKVNLEIRESNKHIFIQNLTELKVKNFTEAEYLLSRGDQQRKNAETAMNKHSSRSHAVFRLNIESRNTKKFDKSVFSTLTLIDLAGSEGLSKTTNEFENRKLEGSLINKSLLALYNVILRLSKKENCPTFRESKLTRILQPMLTGNSKTLVICTVNPLTNQLAESLNTLRFGVLAGGIKTQMKINEKELLISPVSEEFQDDFKKLKAELEFQTEKNKKLKLKKQRSERKMLHY